MKLTKKYSQVKTAALQNPAHQRVAQMSDYVRQIIASLKQTGKVLDQFGQYVRQKHGRFDIFYSEIEKAGIPVQLYRDAISDLAHIDDALPAFEALYAQLQKALNQP